MRGSWIAVAGTLCLLAAADVPVGTTPDSWAPFPPTRIVSPSGQHYAILKSRDGVWPGPYEFVRRREGVPPIEPMESNGSGLTPSSSDQKIRRDPEDRLLAKGTLTQLPMEAAVVDDPPGIALFDQYARLGSGRTLWFLNGEGKIAWSRNLHDLFGGTPKGTTYTTSSRWWSAKWAVDHRAGLAWVLTRGGEFRAVTLRDGNVSVPTAEQASRWLDDEDVLDAVLASDRDPSGFVNAASRIARDGERPLGIRLRAAVLARRGGDPTNHEAWVRQAAVARRTSPSTREPEPSERDWLIPDHLYPDDEARSVVFAALHLDEFTEEATIDVVATALGSVDGVFGRHLPTVAPSFGYGRWREQFVEAFRKAGDAGTTELQRLLEDPNTPAAAVINATLIHWDLGHRGSPPMFLTLIQNAPESDARLAINVLIQESPPDLAAQMLEIAKCETAAAARVAIYFLDHPDADAIPHLEGLADRALDDWTRRTIQNAVEACRQ